MECVMTQLSGTIVTLPQQLNWTAVGSLDQSGRGIFVSPIHGELKVKGPVHLLMKYSSGIATPPHVHTSDYYAVVVAGRFRHFLNHENECPILTAGATWFQQGGVAHQDVCVGPDDGILSIFWPTGFDVTFI
jgi:hypothetical protein